jgi:hypothetical protein
MNLETRKQWIKDCLARGNKVRAVRPHQEIPEITVTKTLDKYEEEPGTDADLRAAGGGYLNLLNPNYEWSEIPPDSVVPPENSILIRLP